MFPLTAVEMRIKKSPFLFSEPLLLRKFRFDPWLPQSAPSSCASSHNFFTCFFLLKCQGIWTVPTCPWGHLLSSSRCVEPGGGSKLCVGTLAAQIPSFHLPRGCRDRPDRTVQLCEMSAPPRHPCASCPLSKCLGSVTCGYAASAQKSSEYNSRSYLGPTSLIKPTSQTHKLAQISVDTPSVI